MLLCLGTTGYRRRACFLGTAWRLTLRLTDDGWKIMEPATGNMACGDQGAGRLPEPKDIQAWVESALER